jgi:hypothetical protein
MVVNLFCYLFRKSPQFPGNRAVERMKKILIEKSIRLKYIIIYVSSLYLCRLVIH